MDNSRDDRDNEQGGGGGEEPAPTVPPPTGPVRHRRSQHRGQPQRYSHRFAALHDGDAVEAGDEHGDEQGVVGREPTEGGAINSANSPPPKNPESPHRSMMVGTVPGGQASERKEARKSARESEQQRYDLIVESTLAEPSTPQHNESDETPSSVHIHSTPTKDSSLIDLKVIQDDHDQAINGRGAVEGTGANKQDNLNEKDPAVAVTHTTEKKPEKTGLEDTNDLAAADGGGGGKGDGSAYSQALPGSVTSSNKTITAVRSEGDSLETAEPAPTTLATRTGRPDVAAGVAARVPPSQGATPERLASAVAVNHQLTASDVRDIILREVERQKQQSTPAPLGAPFGAVVAEPIGSGANNNNNRDEEADIGNSSIDEAKEKRKWMWIITVLVIIVLSIVTAIVVVLVLPGDSGGNAVELTVSDGTATSLPTTTPSVRPSPAPSSAPSTSPSKTPSVPPSNVLSATPSKTPSVPPSNVPSVTPSVAPSQIPSTLPSSQPTEGIAQTETFFAMLDFLTPILQEPPMSLQMSTIRDSDSIPHRVLDWMSNGNNDIPSQLMAEGTANATSRLVDYYALATVYLSAETLCWANPYEFMSDKDICSWRDNSRGVTCNDAEQVIGLDLKSNELLGSMDPGFFLLTNLRDLNLALNFISGVLTPELGNLKQLETLDLTDTFASDKIPTEIGLLTNLRDINLASMHITGAIPSEIGECTKLTSFIADYTILSGNLPTTIGKLTELEFLDLSYTFIEGAIPSEIGNMTSLRGLFLTWAGVEDLPTEIGRLTALEVLWIQSASISGELPTELGALIALEDLELDRNFIYGAIPTELGNLDRLTNLMLSDNDLTGPIPSELGELIELDCLDLSNNYLTGTIPTELSELANITKLRLEGNELNDTIPTEFDQLLRLVDFAVEFDNST